MLRTAIRPQRDVVSMAGRLCKSFEFDYLGAKFYIQETDTGHAVLEETWGGWSPIRAQRAQLILAEFERAKRQRARSLRFR
jgi:hypothetical protein